MRVEAVEDREKIMELRRWEFMTERGNRRLEETLKSFGVDVVYEIAREKENESKKWWKLLFD